MIQLEFLGAMACVGASGILVDTGSEKVVLDYGTKVREIPPQFPLPVKNADALLLSHAHLDHSGGNPILVKQFNLPVYALEVTRDLTELLLNDSIKISHEEGVSLPFNKSDVERTIKNFVPVTYRKPFKVHNLEVTYFDAGHIPGSAMIYLKSGKDTILYTGDLNTNNTRLLAKNDNDLPEVKYLIIESTYSEREHPDRKSQEKELIHAINDTLSRDSPVIIAAFAVGRAQEILLILDKYGIDYPLYLDGMAKKATTIINKYKNLLRDPDSLDRALEKTTYVHRASQRKHIIKQPAVVVTTSGMLTGGPIVQYLKKLYKNEESSLLLTGWQIEGTPGKILLETGRFITEEENLEVKMFVKRFDFSAHAGRSGLLKFIEKVDPEKIFCVHGDHTEEFAQELREDGWNAVAPVANNRIFKL